MLIESSLIIKIPIIGIILLCGFIRHADANHRYKNIRVPIDQGCCRCIILFPHKLILR